MLAGRPGRRSVTTRTAFGASYEIRRYRPRIEGLFARIERWTNRRRRATSSGARSPRTTSPRGTAATPDSRIADPGRSQAHLQLADLRDPRRQGQRRRSTATRPRTAHGVDPAQAHERNRTPDGSRSANRYLKRIRYGNRVPYFPRPRTSRAADAAPTRLDVRGRLRLRRARSGRRRCPSTRYAPGTVPRPIRSPPTAPASRSAPTRSAGAC